MQTPSAWAGTVCMQMSTPRGAGVAGGSLGPLLLLSPHQSTGRRLLRSSEVGPASFLFSGAALRPLNPVPKSAMGGADPGDRRARGRGRGGGRSPARPSPSPGCAHHAPGTSPAWHPSPTLPGRRLRTPVPTRPRSGAGPVPGLGGPPSGHRPLPVERPGPTEALSASVPEFQGQFSQGMMIKSLHLPGLS